MVAARDGTARGGVEAGSALAFILAADAVPVGAYSSTYNSTDYLWDADRCRTDDQLFLNLAVRDSGVSRAVLEPVLPRVRNVSADLPVILFLSRSGGPPVAAIVDLTTRGLRWAQVFRQLGIGYEPLFVHLNQDPGYPYRSAWTYWRRSPSTVRLTDVQVRDLVRLQLGHRLTGIPTVEVARAQARGRSPVVVVADKHGRSYAAVGVPPGHRGVPRGHGGIPPGQVKTGGQAGRAQQSRAAVPFPSTAPR